MGNGNESSLAYFHRLARRSPTCCIKLKHSPINYNSENRSKNLFRRKKRATNCVGYDRGQASAPSLPNLHDETKDALVVSKFN